MFKIDIETCRACGEAVRIIASIEDAGLIDKILTHFAKPLQASGRLPQGHAPPAFG